MSENNQVKRYSLDIVVPCFNEEEALSSSCETLIEFLNRLIADEANHLGGYRILLVDDGCTDATWSLIADLAHKDSRVEGIRLSRNFGHQAAMLAGLCHTCSDAVLTIDADLQDDLDAIPQMLSAFEEGADLALGVRADRRSDSFHKRFFARRYYELLSLLGVKIIPDHADFRLMSRKVLEAVLQYQESNLFLRGIIPSVGFSVAIIPYKRKARVAGTTKYTLRKMVGLALDGVTSFSITPLRIISLSGFLVSVGSMVVGGFFLSQWMVDRSHLVPGWASTVLPLLFLGGFQLLSLGVLGEYVGKIYLETKRRPRFLIREMTSPTSRENMTQASSE